MQKIKIIKTLPHLSKLFLPEKGSLILSSSYSEDILDTLVTAAVYKIKEVKFGEILSVLNSITSERIDNDYLEKYKLGVNQYKRVDIVEEILDFSIKGDILCIWPLGYSSPLRLEFFGEECESCYQYDLITNRKIKLQNKFVLTSKLPVDRGNVEEISVKLDDLSEDINLEKIIFTSKNVSGIEKFHSEIDFEIIQPDFVFPTLYFSNFKIIEKDINDYLDKGYKVFITTHHKDILPKNLHEYLLTETSNVLNNIDSSTLKNLPGGFISKSANTLFLTDRELFGSIYLNRVKEKFTHSSRLKKLLAQFEGEIKIGDYVVHEDYGVGIYDGLQQEKVDGVDNDYLSLKFLNDDKLLVPINQIDRVTKYLGTIDSPPKLTKLGKDSWQKVKKNIRKTILITAKELISHFAKRELSKAEPVPDMDSKDYAHFESEFPYTPTKDQITSINEIISDIEKVKPMNRLLVGDVGFGKTEVIMRAAFKIVENGGQVAVLAPTTVLIAQHYKVFTERFKSFPFRVKSLSRFNSPKENNKIIDELNAGKVDIIVGTHRLLSSDVKFKNLQLLVVDEEQRFGVKQKEKIKEVNYGVHLLSVSATPIPRTLSLALSSIQEISMITTPPEGRKPVETEIIWNDLNKAVNAIGAEISRGGQVYFVHNRVETIPAIAAKLRNMLPGIKFEFAHGQMQPNQLDKIMTDFYLKKFDVLVCTAIIENGLDLPNVNTIIINDAHKFGLSQLYQLRGRVGRSSEKAHCYLLAPRPTNKGNKTVEGATSTSRLQNERKNILKKKEDQLHKLYVERLNALVENNELGAAFRIASKDLEIRGAGTILGEKQHGHITTVGYALYIEMLAEEIERLRGELPHQDGPSSMV